MEEHGQCENPVIKRIIIAHVEKYVPTSIVVGNGICDVLSPNKWNH
jgi:hypothetical protein